MLGTVAAIFEEKQGTSLRIDANTGIWIFSDITELILNSTWCYPDPPDFLLHEK